MNIKFYNEISETLLDAERTRTIYVAFSIAFSFMTIYVDGVKAAQLGAIAYVFVNAALILSAFMTSIMAWYTDNRIRQLRQSLKLNH